MQQTSELNPCFQVISWPKFKRLLRPFDHFIDTFHLHLSLIMITTLMITCIPLFSSFPSHACCYPYPASLTFYDTNVHRFVNPPVPTFPYIVALPYFSPSHHFRFLLNPTSFLHVFTFLEPLLMIRQTHLFCYTFLSHLYLYPRASLTRVVGGTIPDCISINGRRSYPYLYRMFLSVFLVTHYIFTSTIHKIILASFVISDYTKKPRNDPIMGHERSFLQ